MTTITKSDDDSIKQNIPTSSIRQIPIRLSQPSNVASIPSHNHSRISSAVLRSSSLSNPANNQLKRQKTDLTDVSSSDFATTTTTNSSSPIRRAEAMAREAIQGVARFQQQQQRNDPNSENNNPLIRSPGLSRRVIVNLKNNQSVSLDSRLSSANAASLAKPPPTPLGSRLSQRNNLFHIPVLRDIQIPSNSTTTETALQVPSSPSASNQRNSSNFKNEFRMEIPVTVVTNTDQENPMEENEDKDDGIVDYDPTIVTVVERLSSTNGNGNSNSTLKSILKRSTSRETVTRKNVSFMNA